MRSLLLSSTAVGLVAVLSTTNFSLAADLSIYEEPEDTGLMLATEGGDRWSGVYGGVYSGMITLDATYRMPAEPILSSDDWWTAVNPVVNKYDGAFQVGDELAGHDQSELFGVEAGVRSQFGNIVVGLAADLSAASLSAEDSLERDLRGNWNQCTAEYGGVWTGPSPEAETLQDPRCDMLTTGATTLDNFATARGVMGLALSDMLVYGTAGVAVGHVTSQLHESYLALNMVDDPAYATDGYRIGWTAGGGVEMALTDNWSVKVEGLYYDLGSQQSNSVLTQAGADFLNGVSGSLTGPYAGHTFTAGETYAQYVDTAAGYVAKLGLNYQF